MLFDKLFDCYVRAIITIIKIITPNSITVTPSMSLKYLIKLFIIHIPSSMAQNGIHFILIWQIDQ